MNSGRATPDYRERAYLALLCQHSPSQPVRAELAQLLSGYSWNSEDHRVVFEALRGWTAEPSGIRRDLAARVTRLGFPDIDLEPYFARTEVSFSTAIAWLRDELAMEARKPAPAPQRSSR